VRASWNTTAAGATTGPPPVALQAEPLSSGTAGAGAAPGGAPLNTPTRARAQPLPDTPGAEEAAPSAAAAAYSV
jgi:hypothetical protein